MKKVSKVALTSITALTLLSPVSNFADAKTVVANNENMDKSGYSEQLGNFSTSVVMKNQNTAKTKSPYKNAYMVDKNFKAPNIPHSNVIKSTDNVEGVGEDYKVGDTRTFTTINMSTNRDESTQATLMYAGTKGYVWVADQYITKEQAENIGREFDSKIAPMVEDSFAQPSDVDGNGVANILIMDIKDNFEQTGSYTGGYFHPRDLYKTQGSNNGEVFYMDTYPSMGQDRNNLDESTIYSTLAHEYQHMVNFNQNHFVEADNGQTQPNEMDIWLNEALSMASEHMYLDKTLDHRIDYYNRSNSIALGHSLIKWQEQGDVLSNYSLSYLFGQYLRAQASNGDQIFKIILEDRGDTRTSLQNAIHKFVDPNMSIEEFTTNFRVALEKKDTQGIFGFKGEEGFEKVKTIHTNQLPSSLQPQGSVVFDVNDSENIPEKASENIKLVDLSKL